MRRKENGSGEDKAWGCSRSGGMGSWCSEDAVGRESAQGARMTGRAHQGRRNSQQRGNGGRELKDGPRAVFVGY